MTSPGRKTEEVLPYGLWPAPFSPAQLFDLPAEPAHPFSLHGRLYWIQALPDEGGRIVLMRRDGHTDRCLTPAPFSLRTPVHEYGGRCFCLHGDRFVFNNHADGRLYTQPLGPDDAGASEATPLPLTPPDSRVAGFADLVSRGGHVIAVMESRVDGVENRNELVAVRIGAGEASPCVLAMGSDFIAAPTVSPDGRWLAWLEWNHPDMPWDRSRLLRAPVVEGDALSLGESEVVVDAPETTVSQPGFLSDGRLVFAMDSPDSDWSNLVCADGGRLHALTGEEGEFGEAHWVFGNARWRQVSADRLLAVCTGHAGDRLLSVDIAGAQPAREILRDAVLAQLSLSGGQLLLVASPEDRPSRILQLDSPFSESRTAGPVAAPLLASGYASPASLSCDTADGETAWAYHYAPYHPDHEGPAGALPPLLVMVHGGPTSRTSPAFHPLRQYFASLGFAVLDVNHRGSTGYGRRYRQRLIGGWGEVDVADVIACIDTLAEAGRIDPRAVFIRGGSAGGYAVLRALTRYPDRFAGGACYYGIGNLVTLAEITHKFESRYTDRLVGEDFDPERARQPDSRYHARSPVHEIDRLRTPLILFQGLEDKVVPPAVSREVVALLEKRGIPHAYHEYAGEGHGFRQAATRVDSLERETMFYQEILRATDSGGAR